MLRGEYDRLPTEAEQAKAERDVREKEQARPLSPDRESPAKPDEEEREAVHVESREERKVKRAHMAFLRLSGKQPSDGFKKHYGSASQKRACAFSLYFPVV